MEAQLAKCAALGQKDKGPAFVALIQQIITQNTPQTAASIHTLVDYVASQESVGIVVGRHVLTELVKLLGDGTVKDPDLRKRIVEDTISTIQPRIVTYEEQVRPLSGASIAPPLTLALLYRRSAPFASS
jgi:COP9 signalosome complex subunit 4